MDQKWSLYAISCLFSILTVLISFYPFFAIYSLWLLFLFWQQRIKRSVFICCWITYLFFVWYIPPTSGLNMAITSDEVTLTVQGKIKGDIRFTERSLQFAFHEKSSNEKVMVIHFIEKDMDKLDMLSNIGAGAICEITGTIQLAERATNPFQFDYRQYLYKQGIHYQLYVEDMNQIDCHSPNGFHRLYEYRQRLIAQMMETYDDRVYPWVIALVFGDDQYLDEELIQLFQRWGLSHILAISGLHIGIVVALVYFLLIRFSLTTVERAQWIIIFLLPLYAILAGGQPSVLRATGMIVVFFLLQKRQQKMPTVHIISIVFLLLVLANKWIVYHVGFQLSFAVTIGLLLSRQIFNQTNSRLFQLFQISFISQMVIIPLQIVYFHQFNPLSIVLNLVVVPYFSVIVIPLMFFFATTSWLPLFIHFSISDIFNFVHEKVINSIFFLDNHLYFPIVTGEMSVGLAIIYYVLLLLFFIAMESGKVFRQSVLGLLIVAFLMIVKIVPYLQPHATVTILDIGQGDAIIIELPYRQGVMMIDAGATMVFDEKEASRKVYEQVLYPYLTGRGIDHVDALFITHHHLDHFGSVPFLLEDFSVGEVVISPYFAEDIPLWLKDQSVRIMGAGESGLYKQFAFHVLSPDKDYQDKNTNSLVIYTEIMDISFLFTGDLTTEAEKDLIKNYEHLQVDVLKVGHHGSHTSTSELFLRHVKPQIAFIPVGRKNRYDHPHDEIITRLNEHSIAIYRTDKNGAIQLKIGKDSVSIRPFVDIKKD